MAVRERESTPLYVPAAFTNGNGNGSAPSRRRRGWKFWVGMTLAAVLVVAWVAAGAFFVGQGTRLSDGEVKDRIADRVASEQFVAKRERARALDRQEADLNRRWKAQMKRNTKRAYGDGRSSGFTAGRREGFASGAAAGRAEGERRGRKKARRETQRAGYGSSYGAASCIDLSGFPFVC